MNTLRFWNFKFSMLVILIILGFFLFVCFLESLFSGPVAQGSIGEKEETSQTEELVQFGDLLTFPRVC